MLFMVVETFKNGNFAAVGERFKQKGRMLPDGVTYHASWMDAKGTRCFQVMEASDLALLETWVSRWSDLVDFEIIPIQTSAEFWSQK
ncbi:MAG: DUF3303 family protein [Candidatus Acidiferrales bacterium]